VPTNMTGYALSRRQTKPNSLGADPAARPIEQEGISTWTTWWMLLEEQWSTGSCLQGAGRAKRRWGLGIGPDTVRDVVLASGGNGQRFKASGRCGMRFFSCVHCLQQMRWLMMQAGRQSGTGPEA
jgi:hypothetical protein